MIGPSTKTLIARLGISAEKAAQCRSVLSGNYVPSDYLADAPTHFNPRLVMLKLRCLNAIIGGFGVECIESTIPDRHFYYVNMGGTYTPTITFRRGTFRAECWGDVVENDPSYV